MTSKCDGWPWKTLGHLFYAASSLCIISQSSVNSNLSYSPEMSTLDFEIWRMTLTIRHLSYTISNFVHHVISICESKLKLWPGNTQNKAKFVFTSMTFTFNLWPWPFAWASLLSMVITPDIFIMIWWWWKHSERCDGRTDKRTDCTIDRAAWSQLKTYKIKDNVFHHQFGQDKMDEHNQHPQGCRQWIMTGKSVNSYCGIETCILLPSG